MPNHAAPQINPFVALHLAAALNPTNQAWGAQYQQDRNNGPGAPVSPLVQFNPTYQAWNDMYRHDAPGFGRSGALGASGDPRGLVGLGEYVGASPAQREGLRINIPNANLDTGHSPVFQGASPMFPAVGAGGSRIRNQSAGLPTGEYDFIGGSGSRNIDDAFALGQGERSRDFLYGPGMTYQRPSGPISSNGFEGDGWQPTADPNAPHGHPAVNAAGRGLTGALATTIFGPLGGLAANRLYGAFNHSGFDFDSTTPHDWAAIWRNFIHPNAPAPQH